MGSASGPGGLTVLYAHRTQGVGAEGTHIMGMYQAFEELGHEVSMHCLPGCNPFEKNSVSPVDPGRSGPGTLKKAFRWISDRAPQSLFEFLELTYNIPLFFQLAWNCLRRRPHLLYERYSLNTIAPAMVCRLFGIRHVLEINDSVVISRTRDLRFAGTAKILEGFAARSADLVITITERFRELLIETFDLAGDRVLVCPNAVSRSWFADTRRDESLAGRLGLAGKTVLGCHGQFVSWHGLQSMVEAIADLAMERNLFFLFIGDGPVRESVMAAARKCGIADRVLFTGMVPFSSIRDHLSLLDIAVLPDSNTHGSPMKLMEFMAMGLPVLAPDYGPIREVLGDEETGSLFRAGDMHDLKRRLITLLDDREKSAALGRKARDFVFENLTWARHACEVLARLGMRAGPV